MPWIETAERPASTDLNSGSGSVNVMRDLAIIGSVNELVAAGKAGPAGATNRQSGAMRSPIKRADREQ
jgi:hypothetical protein